MQRPSSTPKYRWFWAGWLSNFLKTTLPYIILCRFFDVDLELRIQKSSEKSVSTSLRSLIAPFLHYVPATLEVIFGSVGWMNLPYSVRTFTPSSLGLHPVVGNTAVGGLQ